MMSVPVDESGANPEKDIVAELIIEPFGGRSYDDQMVIVKSGRPCPSLPKLCQVTKDHCRDYNRRFTDKTYQHFPWVCGSTTFSKIYCWPCLLFSRFRTDIWVRGFSNLSGLTTSAKTHENGVCHLMSVVDLHVFSRTSIEEEQDEALEVGNELHNQKVMKNREILKILIDATCFLAQQELPFRGHDESLQSLNRGNYIETLNFLKKRDSQLADHLGGSETSIDIQNDLIFAIDDVLNDTILDEVKDSEFVAVMIDETSDVRCRSQLSTVLRFFHEEDNCVQERFIGFSDMSDDRTADALLALVKKTVSQYGFGGKFIAQTYDGAAVMPGHLSGLQQKVKHEYPNALHTHCHAHDLHSVLAQGLNHIPECHVFFSTLNGVATFSSHSTNMFLALQDHLKRSIPTYSPTIWCFTSPLVITVKTYRETIREFFEDILEDSSGKWSGPDKCTAYGYTEFFGKFETTFLLNLFAPLFSDSGVLFNFLQSERADITTCINQVKDFQNLLRSARLGFSHCARCKHKYSGLNFTKNDRCDGCQPAGFQPIWDETVSSMGMPDPMNMMHSSDGPCVSAEQRYRELYSSIIDNLTVHVTDRFASLGSLTFCDLLNPRNFILFSDICFPHDLLNGLRAVYPNVFDIAGLKNELAVVYRNKMFHGKSPSQLTTFLKAENLHVPFKETFRLAKLIVTIPATTSSFESFPALERVHAYLRSTEGEASMSSLAKLSIEKRLLVSLLKTDDFHELVIRKFCAKSKRLDFDYVK